MSASGDSEKPLLTSRYREGLGKAITMRARIVKCQMKLRNREGFTETDEQIHEA